MLSSISFEKRVVFVFLCLSSIVINFNLSAISAVLPLMSHDLNVSEITASKIISYYMIPYGLAALAFAPLTKKYSYAATLGVSLVIFSVTSFVCFFAHSLQEILNARSVMGIAASGIAPISLMVIGQFFEKEHRGRLVGMFFGCAFFANLAGIVMSGLIAWRFQFLVPAVLGVMTIVTLIIFRPHILSARHKGSVNYWEAFKIKDIRNVFIFIFIVSFFYHGMRNWIGVYLNQFYHMDKLGISFFFTLMAVGGLSGQLFGGHLSDGKSRLMACYVGLIGLGIGTMFLAGIYTEVVLGIILFAISVFWTIGHNGVSTVLTDFEEDNRPVVASLNSSVRFISGGIGFYLSGFCVAKSFSLTFLGIGVGLLGLALLSKYLLPSYK